MKFFRTSFLSLVLMLPSVAFAQQPPAALQQTSARPAGEVLVDAVGELLKKANLEEFLKAVGVWK